MTSTYPIDGHAVSSYDTWYLYKSDSRNCRATLRISSPNIYGLVNQTNAIPARAEIVAGTLDRLDGTFKHFIWNPERELLIPIGGIIPTAYVSGDTYSFTFTAMWSPPPTANSGIGYQCTWYSTKSDADYEHMIPPVARKFKLAPREWPELPEFKDGEEVYAWLEQQLS